MIFSRFSEIMKLEDVPTETKDRHQRIEQIETVDLMVALEQKVD